MADFSCDERERILFEERKETRKETRQRRALWILSGLALCAAAVIYSNGVVAFVLSLLGRR